MEYSLPEVSYGRQHPYQWLPSHFDGLGESEGVLPVFREFWAWLAFVLMAAGSLGVALATNDLAWDWYTIRSVGTAVEPMLIVSAILVYTATEGGTMLADSFKRKLVTKAKTEGKAEGKG